MKSTHNDHRTRVTKTLISGAFLSLLQSKPIQSISIRELCAEAGINRGTFYTHYQDIYDLLAQVEEGMLGDLRTALEPIYDTAESEHSLVDVCASIFQCLKDNADLCTVMLGEYGDPAFLDRLLMMGREATLTAYSQHFQKAERREIEYFYAFVSSGCIGLLRQWIADGMTLPAMEVAQMAERIMLSGIGFFREKGDSPVSG